MHVCVCVCMHMCKCKENGVSLYTPFSLQQAHLLQRSIRKMCVLMRADHDEHPHSRTTSLKRAYHESTHSIPPAKRCTLHLCMHALVKHAATTESLTFANLH